MKSGFRQSMAWLHTWSGLLIGWLLFAIFLTGTISYYREELTQWMRPELRPAPIEASAAARVAVARLGQLAPDGREWVMDLPNAREPFMKVFFRNDPGAGPAFGAELLDPGTGLPAAVRATLGADSIFYFHFDLLLPSIWGRLIVGFATIVMLVGIITGIVTHRRIFRDFFAFRPGRGQRSWLDAHNAFGVMALPYHLLISYSGLIPLLLLYMPWGVDVAFKGNRPAFLEAAGQRQALPAKLGRPMPLAGIDGIVEAAAVRWEGGRPGRIQIFRPGDGAARIILYRSDSETVAHRAQALVFDGTTGVLLEEQAPPGAVTRTHSVLYGLHVARFAEPVMRALFFTSGLAGTAMIGTGLLLWSVKRSQRVQSRRAALGLAIVDRLNLGVLVGLPVGIAGLLIANRVLPLDLAARQEWEVRSLFAGWVLVAAWTMLRPKAAAWSESLWLGAVAFMSLPLLSAVTTDRILWRSLQAGDWTLFGIDLVLLATGLAFAVAARKAGSRPIAGVAR